MYAGRPRCSCEKLVEAVRKPGSVPGSGYPLPDDGHSSGSAVTGSLKRPTRRHGPATLNASLLGLAPDGVYLASAVTDGPGELLPHPFTLTCLSRRTSLCGTFPWGRPRWTLSSIMPCGARTFLSCERPSGLLQPKCRLRLKPNCGVGQSLRRCDVALLRLTPHASSALHLGLILCRITIAAF